MSPQLLHTSSRVLEFESLRALLRGYAASARVFIPTLRSGVCVGGAASSACSPTGAKVSTDRKSFPISCVA